MKTGGSLLSLCLTACGAGETNFPPPSSGSCSVDADCVAGGVCVNGQCGSIPGDSSPRPGDPTPGDGASRPGDNAGADSNAIDTQPPRITIVAPSNDQLVPRTFAITATISDASPLATVEAVIADAHTLPLSQAQGAWRAQFDTGNDLFGVYKITVEVRATDQLGNFATAGIQVILDHFPPLVALDSPPLRVRRRAVTGDWECSRPFDPHGDSAVNHGDVIGPASPWGHLIYPRIRIEDVGNGSGASFIRIAGLDPTSLELLIFDATEIAASSPLVAATAPSTFCDHVPSAAAAAAMVLPLVEVPKAGQADYRPTGGVLPADCDIDGTAGAAPLAICAIDEAAGITTWIAGDVNTGAIHVLPPYEASSLRNCTGASFDTRSISIDGPVCLVARAADNVGNAFVSRPIAICVDNDDSGECAAFDADAVRAQCTGACTPLGFTDPVKIE